MNLRYSLFFIFIDFAIPGVIHSFSYCSFFTFIFLNGNASLNILHNFSDMIVYVSCAFSLSNTGGVTQIYANSQWEPRFCQFLDEGHPDFASENQKAYTPQ